MRVCPQCGHRSEQLTCPNDGLVTLDEAVLAPSDPLMGRIVAAKYRIEAHLGSGGMGSVYRARHIETGGEVALKVMIPDRASRPVAIKRFSLEAQNAAALRHANTVRVLDFGADDDLMFLVMEFLEGESLQALIKRERRLEWRRASRIARQVLMALWEAHEHSRRIVHRDIKPANILICKQVGDDDFVKVVDFGVARSLEGSGAGTQGAIGTPHAMAPEQWGGSSDARSDLYSVGCMLYEMLTGHPPFVASEITSPSALLMRLATLHMHSIAPPVTDDAPETPPGLARLVHALLAKRPDDRPQTARITLALLDRVLQGEELPDLEAPLEQARRFGTTTSPRRSHSSGARPLPDDHDAGSHAETLGSHAPLGEVGPLVSGVPFARGRQISGDHDRGDAHGEPLDDGDHGSVISTIEPAAVQLVPPRAPHAGLALQVQRQEPRQEQRQAPRAHQSGASTPSFISSEPAPARPATAARQPSAPALGPRLPANPEPTGAVVAAGRRPVAVGGTSAPAAGDGEGVQPRRSGWIGWAVLAAVVFGVGGIWMVRQRQLHPPVTALPAMVPAAPALPSAATVEPLGAPRAPDGAAPSVRGGGFELDEGSKLDEDPEGRRPLLTYRAHLGAEDHKGRNGAKIKVAADVLIQDRVNVHEGKHVDALDTKDPLYSNASARAGLRKLLQRALSKELSKRIVEREVDVEVQVWKDYAQVIVLKR